jgi:F-box-like
MSIDNVSQFNMMQIFSYLTVDELCQTEQVCKKWNEIAKTDDVFL